MQFIRTTWGEAEHAVSQRLTDNLSSGQRVAWLVSGGSQIEANVRIMASVPDHLTSRLTVMPIDERYGPPGHNDSNWAQMLAAGFEPKQARAVSALKAGLDFAQAADYFEQLVRQVVAENAAVIGQLGIGPDGHISGILPHSPACGESAKLVIGYEAAPLKRLTATFPALRRLNAAYVLAFGDSKLAALRQLKDQSLPLADQPAQILKELTEAYIFNDQLGD